MYNQALADVWSSGAGIKCLYCSCVLFVVADSACGTIQDWVAKEGGADLSFTLELRPSAGTGNRGFLVSVDEIKPSGEEVLAGVKAVMKDIQEDPDRVFYKT